MMAIRAKTIKPRFMIYWEDIAIIKIVGQIIWATVEKVRSG